MSGLLVSVVIPAWNAQATIDRTLRSVRGQTWTTLEIVVVDDGSTDGTCEVVEAHAAADKRVRLVRQANSGVAAARNRGWQEASSDLIAFVDADDLWAPGKLDRQMAVLTKGGDGMGLVFSRYAQIDEADTIIRIDDVPVFEGDVLDHLFRGNFVGNGSAALVRRAALEQAGGFEPALFRAGAQGCEDILFYLRVAERWTFGAVHEPDIGYRLLPQAMSADLTRMFRSWLMVRAEMLKRHPEKASSIEAGVRGFGQWLVEQALRRRQFAQLPALLSAIAGWRGRAMPAMLNDAAHALLRQRRAHGHAMPAAPVRFMIGEPA